MSGTSISAPIVAGALALIWSYDQNMTPDDVESALYAGCRDLGGFSKDDQFGQGRINVYNSILSLRTY